MVGSELTDHAPGSQGVDAADSYESSDFSSQQVNGRQISPRVASAVETRPVRSVLSRPSSPGAAEPPNGLCCTRKRGFGYNTGMKKCCRDWRLPSVTYGAWAEGWGGRTSSPSLAAAKRPIEGWCSVLAAAIARQGRRDQPHRHPRRRRARLTARAKGWAHPLLLGRRKAKGVVDRRASTCA